MITYRVPHAEPALDPIVILEEQATYTFSDYFQPGLSAADVAKFHGYKFKSAFMTWRTAAVDTVKLDALHDLIVKGLPNVALDSEMARREFLIAPIIFQAIVATGARVKSEMTINVSDTLNGKLDYFIQSVHEDVVVVEAKRDNLDFAFAQLTAQLIAVDQWTDSEQPDIVGAVSNGVAWQFGRLNRSSKMIERDLTLYVVPKEMERIVGILTALLEAER